MHALLVAQDPDELAVLTVALQRAGLTVTSASVLERILQTGPGKPVDMVVLAPKDSPPLAQIRRFRAQTQVPLLIVVGQVDEMIQYELLEAGADLLVPRPYSAKLLIAQVRALLRRAGGIPFFALPTLSAAGVTLDPATRAVELDGDEARRLTHLEFRLLYTLMTHQGQTLSAETLVEHVWGYTGEGNRDLVRGLVSRLRAKVEPDPRAPTFIITVPGLGYSFNPQL
jgi:DNA-binding response OmpR family regulator